MCVFYLHMRRTLSACVDDRELPPPPCRLSRAGVTAVQCHTHSASFFVVIINFYLFIYFNFVRMSVLIAYMSVYHMHAVLEEAKCSVSF